MLTFVQAAACFANVGESAFSLVDLMPERIDKIAFDSFHIMDNDPFRDNKNNDLPVINDDRWLIYLKTAEHYFLCW